MKGNQAIKFLGRLGIIVGLILAGWLIGISGVINLNQANTPQVAIEQNIPQTVSVMFDFGEGTVKTFPNINLQKETTSVFDLLTILSAENKITLDYKDYSGDLGVFIKSINTVPSEGISDKWWQFWVNNVYSTSGVSNYQVKAGDVIEFKFIKGQ